MHEKEGFIDTLESMYNIVESEENSYLKWTVEWNIKVKVRKLVYPKFEGYVALENFGTVHD